MRLANSPREPVVFGWNSSKVEGREGDTVASALHAAGQLYLIPSRKFHQPRGLSGSFIHGHLATVDGIPNCRLDRMVLRAGMDVRLQGAWPSVRMDLLGLSRLLPRRWLRGGFEHPRFIPDQSILWKPWERALAFVAGGAQPPQSIPASIPNGCRIAAATVIVGGGPAAVLQAHSANPPVVLVTRGQRPSNLPEHVSVYPSHDVFALYNAGSLVAAAPLDPAQPALLIDAENVVLATGMRSCPPLVRGAALPGVLDASMALRLARNHGVAPGKRVAVIGTSKGRLVAHLLSELGVKVLEFWDVDTLVSIRGRNCVTGIEVAGDVIPCDAVVHAGPWRADMSLPFQAGWGGDLRLVAGALPQGVRLDGSVSDLAEPVSFGAGAIPDRRAFVCPCMDVTVDEVLTHIERGVTHVEEIKRLTGCGMGSCQGVPCWDLLAAVVAHATGQSLVAVGHPTYRPPRAAITFSQAAGLTQVTEVAS